MNLDTDTRHRKYTMSLHAGDIPYSLGFVYYAKPKKSVTIQAVIEETCNQCGIAKSSLLGRAKSDYYVHPRQLAMLLCRELLPQASAPVIGRAFSRDHTTILHGVKAARERINWCDETRHAYLAVRRALGAPAEAFEATRTCMSCQQPFVSSGPENRLCNRETCKNRRRKMSSSLAL